MRRFPAEVRAGAMRSSAPFEYEFGQVTWRDWKAIDALPVRAAHLLEVTH